MLVALAGGNFIHHAAGLVDSDLTACLEKYVIDNDICGLIIRTLQGVAIRPGDSAFRVIEEVGPGGNFLTQDHTVQHLRSGEIFVPSSACRNESLTAIEKATDRAKSILAGHYPDIVTRETEQQLRETFQLKFDRNGEPL